MAHFSAMSVFGTNVQKCLDARGWTKQQLADAVSMNRSEISLIVHGKRNITLNTAEAIARALEYPISELLSTNFKIREFAA